MTEQIKTGLSIKDRLYSITPWGIAERRVQRSVQNVAAAMTLDIVKKTRRFSVEEAVPLTEATQTLLAENEKTAFFTLARNGAIDTQGVIDTYPELHPKA